MFISVHANAFPQSNSKGAQTFYSPAFKENKRAAKLIQAELIRNLKNTTRKAKPLENVYLVKYAKKPGVLVEVGFLSNDQERMNLQNEVYQDDVALSIYTGVIRYFLKEDVADWGKKAYSAKDTYEYVILKAFTNTYKVGVDSADRSKCERIAQRY